MRLSDRLRQAIWENQASGTAFLHAPKAAGSSLKGALVAAGVPMLNYPALVQAHRAGCDCGAPECRAALEREERFLAQLNPTQPWLLNLGHMRLTAAEATDIPPRLPIVLPLRDNADRLVSLFRYDWSRYAYARGMHTLITQRLTLAWHPRLRTRNGRRLHWGNQDRVEVMRLVRDVPTMVAYIEPDGYTVRWRAWTGAALSSGTGSAFWYGDLLPAFEGPEDLRWSRLVPMTVDQIGAWLEREFGVALPHVNRSLDDYGDLDVQTAANELRAAAPEFTEHDQATWDLLQARAREVAASD